MGIRLVLRLESGRTHRYSFRVPSDKGELRGEVDDSATAPIYAVQHCVVDTSSGEVVLAPTNDEDRAQELAARLTQPNDAPAVREDERS